MTKITRSIGGVFLEGFLILLPILISYLLLGGLFEMLLSLTIPIVDMLPASLFPDFWTERESATKALIAMGKTIVHQGGPGAGQHTKMVNQTLIATNMIGVCEALLYGYKAGLDLEVVMQSVASGAAGSWSLSNLAPRIIANNFDPGFFVEHFIKDMGIALAESKQMGLSMPGLALAHQLLRRSVRFAFESSLP